jgi:DNA-binding NarL/FixJ family response regulator
MTEFDLDPRRTAAPATGARPVPRRKVLLAEADSLVADDFRRALEAQGFEVIGPAATVDEALALASTSQSLHGAVLDIRLGDEAAYAVADILRTRSAPFAFVTAHDPIDIPYAHQAAPCWSKPIAGEALASQLHALIAVRDR